MVTRERGDSEGNFRKPQTENEFRERGAENVKRQRMTV